MSNLPPIKYRTEKDRRLSKLGKVHRLLSDDKNDFNPINLLKRFGFYRIELGGMVLDSWLMGALVDKYGKKFFSTGGKLYSNGDVVDRTSLQLCVIDDVYFVTFREKDLLDTHATTTYLYVPIWQRNKAKVVLKRVVEELAPKRRIYTDEGKSAYRATGKAYPKGLETQHQYVRKDVYDRIDAIFKRLTTDPDYYLNAGKKIKETILLHGEPGTGKTSLIMHMGAKYNLNVAIISPTKFIEEPLTLNRAKEMSFGKPYLILMEDIDSTDELLLSEFRSKAVMIKDAPSDGGTFSYSNFINKLDGGLGVQNCIVCLTTNYKERLIPSLTRPGRVDQSIELIPLTSEEIALEVSNTQSEYIKTFENGTFAIAHIVDLRLCQSEEQVDEVVKWIKA